MNPELPAITTTAGDVLAAGFRLFRRTLWRCLPVALLAVLVGQLPSVYLQASGEPSGFLAGRSVASWVVELSAALINLYLWTLILLRQLELPSARLRAARILPAVLGLIVAGVALIALGTVFLVFPGLYLLVALWPSFTLLVEGELGARAAIDASLRLVRGHWWHVAGTLLLALMAALGLFVLGSLVGLLLAELAAFFSRLVTGLLGALFMPFVTALAVALVHDLRHRHSSSCSNSD